MFTRISMVALVCLFSLGATAALYLGIRPTLANYTPPPDPLRSGIPIHSGAPYELFAQTINGPQICTAYGDPFSPWNSVFHPGPYTYEYTIVIPPTYDHDTLRVELFDPDSINAANQTITIHRSQTAVAYGLSPTITVNASGSRINPLLIDTGEWSLLHTFPELTLDQINPFWLFRSDANRGMGEGHGDGRCGTPGVYTPRYNTQTLYELYYYSQDNGDLIRQDLAAYTGQVGDGIRDDGDHQTDGLWVSPGGQTLADQPVFVPADFGSFEIDLTQHLPGIYVDPDTGNRYIYMGITALSGASSQPFDLRAGPPNLALRADGNFRRLQMVNEPQLNDTAGVRILAQRYAPRLSLDLTWQNKPALYIGPEYAGLTMTVTVFDLDAGSQPPLIYFFDTLAFRPGDLSDGGIDPDLTDWALSFGGVTDPNPEGRCFPPCTDQWITPPFTITIPSDADCDYQNPTPESCTPFWGGLLYVRYRTGYLETQVWDVVGPADSAHDPTTSCTAFPIGAGLHISSVTPPGSGDGSYPDPGEFLYPPNPPAYERFVWHTPDVPLTAARPGTVFRYYGGIDQDNFTYLRWNSGISSVSATLVARLRWPGNSRDFTDHGDAGQPASPNYPHVVRGYVNPLDNMDTVLGVEKRVPLQFGAIPPSVVAQAVNEHIDRGRILRLPVWDEIIGAGSDAAVQTHRFGLFRLLGHRLSGSNPWLLLEFTGWDDSCGQIAPPPPTPTPTNTPSPTPTNTPSPTPTDTPSPTPTDTPTPTSTPSPTPVVIGPSPPINYRLYLPLLFR